MKEEKSTLVYSTDQAIPRERPQKKLLQASARPAKQTVTVRLERKGRGGKSVTVIEGLRMPHHERDILLKDIKTMLGTGGTVKNASLEIQGDHRDAIMGIMDKKGYKSKRSGG
jgi:translation initiation factor 1